MAHPLALSLVLALAGGAAIPAAAGPPVQSPRPAVLTFTGAASRGAYQAGLAHTVMRARAAMGDGAIVGVAGISAGGVNALFAAFSTCRADLDTTAASESPLFRAWDALEWRAMFPFGLSCGDWTENFGPGAVCEGDSPWGPDDGLASLNALAPVERSFHALLARTDGWRDGCRVPIGIGLSAAVPTAVPFTATPLTGLRAHALFELRVVEGRPRLCAPTVPAEQLDGSAEAVVLPTLGRVGDCDALHPADVWSVVRAGAAPPVYAGAQPVRHCARVRVTQPALPDSPPSSCPVGSVLRTSMYLDGALLEAIPVGLSLAAGRLAQPDASFEVLTLDATQPVPESPVPDGVIGYAWYRRFLSTFLEVSRYYEAQTVARYQQTSPEHGPVISIAHVRTPRRIYGDDLMGMGAFVHPALRRADFRRGQISAYTVILPSLCVEATEPAACAVEVLKRTGAWSDDELRSAFLAMTPDTATSAPLSRLRERLQAEGAKPDGFTPQGCQTGALIAALGPPGTERDALAAASLAEMLANAERSLEACEARFEGLGLVPVRLPDGRPLSRFSGWWLDELRHLTERARDIETAGETFKQAERLLGYVLDVRRVGEESGLRVGSLPLASRPTVNTPLRVLEHIVYPVSVGGLVAPRGGLIGHWEYLAYSPRRGLTPVGLGATARWLYRPADPPESTLGVGPTVFSLWDPRMHPLLSSLGMRGSLVPDFLADDGVLRNTRVDGEVYWRLLGAHLEVAGGPSFSLRKGPDPDRVDYRVIFSVCSVNLVLDALFH